MSTHDEARRMAEEALAFMDAALLDEMPPLPTQVKALADAVRALLAAEPEAVVCDGHGETYDEVYRDLERLRESVEIERDGQRSMVRALAEIHRLSRLDVAISLASDAPSPARDEVREAAERLRNKMRATYADPRYMNVWATAQEHLGPYTGPNWTEEANALDAALDARWRRMAGGKK